MPATGFLNKARWLKKLERIPIETREQLLEQLGLEAQTLNDDQRALVPVGERGGGQLRDSIGNSSDASGLSKGELRRGRVRKDGVGVIVFAGGPDAWYAHFVEFGTVDTPAQPFFFPPYRALRRGIRNRAASRVRKAARDAIRDTK